MTFDFFGGVGSRSGEGNECQHGESYAFGGDHHRWVRVVCSIGLGWVGLGWVQYCSVLYCTVLYCTILFFDVQVVFRFRE